MLIAHALIMYPLLQFNDHSSCFTMCSLNQFDAHNSCLNSIMNSSIWINARGSSFDSIFGFINPICTLFSCFEPTVFNDSFQYLYFRLENQLYSLILFNNYRLYFTLIIFIDHVLISITYVLGQPYLMVQFISCDSCFTSIMHSLLPLKNRSCTLHQTCTHQII